MSNATDMLNVPGGGHVTISRTVDANGSKLNVTYAVGERGISELPPTSTFFPPPLKQAEQGIQITSIKCNYDFILLKLDDSSSYPICVSTQSAQKLIERGWSYVLSDYTHLRG